jgi:phosphoserine phosphatase
MSTAHALGMECEVTVADAGSGAHADGQGTRTHVIVLGRPLRPGAVSHVAQRIADLGANIESITQLSSEPVASLELLVRTHEPAQLRAALVQASEDTGVDIAVEPAGLQRRAKRLVALDVDSTLIQDEAIDVLAERAGVHGEVGQITARAMAGELDFAESLRARVELLTGLPRSEVERVRDELRLTPGARTFVRTLHGLGYRVGVVSGGFSIFTDRFVAELGLDFAAANHLEIVDGVVTGRVVGDVLDRAGKAAALTRFAAQFGVPMSQTVAVGDGANDIDMLETAGLGIAFNAKSALRATADTSLNLPYLDTVLFVLGISGDDVAAAAAVTT